MRLEYTIDGGECRWLVHFENSKPEVIGDVHGFSLSIGKASLYKLITPRMFQERTPAFLLKCTYEEVKCLGRVSLPWDKLAAWAENLINREPKGDAPLLSPSPFTPINMAEEVLKQMEQIASEGLNKVYSSHHDFLYDLFPDLPWDREGRTESLTWIVEQPRLKIASDTIQARGGPDYLAMFRNTLVDMDSESDIYENDPKWQSRN